MNELVFPVLGTLFVIVVVLPSSALVAKLALVAMERRHDGPLHGLQQRYLMLVGSSLLPAFWFLSAGMHQAESGRSVVACLFDHDAASLCFEPVLFACTLTITLLGCIAPHVRARSGPAISQTPRARALVERLAQLGIAQRVRVTEHEGFALATGGLVCPIIIVGATYAEQLDDQALVAAIAHEAEHVRALDPMRYLLLDIALAMNPFGKRLLAPHAARWLDAREAHCDREAVLRGASPLALAHAIVRAARPSRAESVALGARDVSMLKLRVGLLVAFAERPPVRCCHRSVSVLSSTVVLLAFTLLLPHRTGTAALDALHTGAEHSLTYFLR
jgi:hypothetical protein